MGEPEAVYLCNSSFNFRSAPRFLARDPMVHVSTVMLGAGSVS